MNRTLDARFGSGVARGVAWVQRERGIARLIALSAAVVLIFSLLRPEYYLSMTNFQTIGLALPEIGLLSLAAMISFISGGIDLSVVSTGVLSSLTVAYVFRGLGAEEMTGGSAAGVMLLALVAAVLMGALAGAFNGFLVSVVGITPILATLGTMTLYNGLAIVVTQGEAIYGMPDVFLELGNGTVGSIPISLIVLLVVGVVLAVVVNRTALGTRIRLVGANPTASRFSGINNRHVLMLTYMTSGVLAGVAGILMASRAASASADYGSSYLLLAITIAILGGTNPNGGFGTVFGVMLATLTLQLVSSGFNIMRLTAFEYTIAQGVVLIAVIVADAAGDRRRSRKAAVKAAPHVAAP